jgi:monoamine oxidase
MGALDLAVTSDSPRVPFTAPRPADFALSGRGAAHVVILGAGIAGLTCAYELGKAGYQCTLLEAQPRVGGRNFTVRGGTRQTDLDGNTQVAQFAKGLYLNAGPARIAQWMVTVDYCRELGVPLEIFANVNAAAYVYEESGNMQPGNPLRRRAAKADMFGYVAELLAKATDQGALDKELTAEDKERLLDFLRDFGSIGKKVPGNPDASWCYTGGENRGYTEWPGATGSPGVSAGPPLSLSTILSYELGDEISFETDYEDAMVMLQPVGGMDAIPTALTQAVGLEKVQLNCVVTAITNQPDRVSVTYRDASGQERLAEADYCIATLPPQLLAKVRHNLSPGVQRGLTTFRPVSVGKIGLEYRSRWWETDDKIFGGITETDMDIDQIWYPSSGFHSERGILLGYYNSGSDSRTYDPLSPGAREAKALDQGQKIHGPRYRAELASSFSMAWARTPYIEGGWQKIPGGPENPVYAPLNTAAGRVYFAGDWLSHEVSWQHGAFCSARKTVGTLHSRVLST